MARILIVEDEAIQAMSVELQVQAMGHESMGTVSSAEEALDIIGRARPDLVIIDILIQGRMDGTELAGLIRERYGIPVMYGTAHTDAATLRRAEATAHSGILFKPFDAPELEAAIRKALATPPGPQRPGGKDADGTQAL